MFSNKCINVNVDGRSQMQGKKGAAGVERTDRQLLITPRDPTVTNQTEQDWQTQTCVGLPNPLTPTHP